MLACVLQNGKTPCAPRSPFYTRGGCRVVTTLSFSVRAVEICQMTSPRDCRRCGDEGVDVWYRHGLQVA
jgi:hypothetical protein